MKTKIFSLVAPLLVAGSFAMAQDKTEEVVIPEESVEETTEEEANKLSISGSVDLFYNYDFAGTDAMNIGTSFNEGQNSINLGMANVILSQTLGKASFVADLSFGPRSNGSIGDGNFHIQNLYASYQLSEKLSATAGFMGTFVGYEVISPTGNFNYSTSYLFSNGPFQNAGLKFDYSFSDKVALMVGIFTNEWDSYNAAPNLGMSGFGAQLYVAPVDGLDVYLNGFSSSTRTVVDLTAGYQVSDAFYLGVNAAWADKKDAYTDADLGLQADQLYSGVATYLQYSLTETFALGARYEYFKDIARVYGADNSTEDFDGAVNAVTLTGNVALGPLTVIPEFRFDTADSEIFFGSKDAEAAGNFDSKSATQATLAVVYAF
ncbi:outer membrane beta-barrel protein [Flammeovirga sp. SubArs3]|uniref:outer membrane beta-barrel protein n=1 Tax=Flammeovirga sp. SubArs3 TaxID=2995316 RepID=UPI00248BAA70|nr:outer membrane beta-barrel protein [Flammeovirga sp. SubArs3]